MSASELPKYDCAPYPATLLDPARDSPLNSNRLYILSVYDQKRVADDDFSTDSYHSVGWATVGLARFNAEDRAFHLTDHKITAPYWNEALHALSWSDAHEGTARVPVGSLHFSDDLQSFLGIVMASDGQKRTISGMHIAGYHTKLARDGGGAFDSFDFFYGGITQPEGTPKIKPLCQLWDPDNYDDSDEDNGFKYDVSPDAHFVGGTGSLNYVKPRGSGEYAFVSFDIKFKSVWKEFEGNFSDDNGSTISKWTGKSFDIPENVRILIEERLKKGAGFASDTSQVVTLKAQDSASTPPSYAVDIYLPAATFDVPPPYTPNTFLAKRSIKGSNMDVLKLWQISSIQSVVDPDSGDKIVKDIVQDYVGKASNNLFMTSLPDSVKKKFRVTDPHLASEEKDILKQYHEFNDAASIPFFAKALRESAVATPEQKNQINDEKVHAWFTAMSSLKPPEDKPDPVIEAGLKRDSDNLKKLQDSYSAQMDDLYKYYYREKVKDFKEYCSNQSTAKKWFDEFKIYVESNDFMAQWVSRNSDINYKDGSREIMEASVKFSILEAVGYPDIAVKDRKTPEIIKDIASAAAMASCQASVQYDPTLEKALRDLIEAVGNSTEEEIREKYGHLIEEFQQLQILMQAYGGTRAFADWFLKVAYHYGQGKEGWVSWLQMAGGKMKDIWNKFAKGKSREEIIAQFGKEAVELAEEPMKDAAKWKKISKAWGKFKGGVKTIFSHLALAGAAAGLIAVASGTWGAVDTTVKVYLGLEAFAYAMKGLKLFAATALGKLIKTKLLDKNAFLKRVGDWFSKEGLPKELPGTSLISKLVGRSVKSFLKRLGAVLSVVAVVVCAFDFKSALASGDPMDIAENALYLVLAIIDVAVVATGMIANLAGASAVAACAGPIGLAIAAVGLIVAVIFLIIKLVHPKPPPDPVQEFIDGELKDHGFKK